MFKSSKLAAQTRAWSPLKTPSSMPQCSHRNLSYWVENWATTRYSKGWIKCKNVKIQDLTPSGTSKRGIPKVGSTRDRALKRKYGGRKFPLTAKNRNSSEHV